MIILSNVKLQLPEPYSVQFDLEVLSSFFYHLEGYFSLTGVTDPHKQGELLSLLVSDHAAVWFCS